MASWHRHDGMGREVSEPRTGRGRRRETRTLIDVGLLLVTLVLLLVTLVLLLAL